MSIRTITLSVMLLCLCCGRGWGQAIYDVKTTQDNIDALTNCCHPEENAELKPLTEDYYDFLSQRILPMKLADVDAVFGPKIETLPKEAVRPLFVPIIYRASGLVPPDDRKDHTDFHTVGTLGYIQVVYQFDGESVATAVLYLKEDAQFVPIKTTNDIPQRNEWDKARFQACINWTDERMPKIIDLGEVYCLPV